MIPPTPPPFRVEQARLLPLAGAFTAAAPDVCLPAPSSEDDRHRVRGIGRLTVATGRTRERGLRGEQNRESGWIELHRFGRYIGIYWHSASPTESTHAR